MKQLSKYALAMFLIGTLAGCTEKEAPPVDGVGTGSAPAPKEQGAIGTVPGKEITAPAPQAAAPQSRAGDTSFKE